MTPLIRGVAVALLSILLGSGCQAPAPECPVSEPQGPLTPQQRSELQAQSLVAFDFLRSLEGEWTAHRLGEGTEGHFDLISGGTAVMQRTGFVAIYYVDGDGLKMVLFPDEGYQAVLRSKGFEKVGEGPQVRFVFDFVSATNMPPNARRPRRVIFTRSDDDRLMQTWTWFDGVRDTSLNIALTRKKPDPAAAPAADPAPPPATRTGG